jgi:hypothetical protein
MLLPPTLKPLSAQLTLLKYFKLALLKMSVCAIIAIPTNQGGKRVWKRPDMN